MGEVRTRFAPSPTGYLHVGGLRTALFTYAIAKKAGGKFILRIEDTDQERYVEGASEVIYRTLRAVGLNWDEGPDVGGDYGPYIQTERRAIYKEYAEKLVDLGGAYYCFCDKERLTELKAVQEASGVNPMYDRHCRNLFPDEIKEKLSAGVPYVIRQKIPLEGTTTFHDVLYGDITVENSTLDDQILLKTDGLPTYNFANVVDDHLMKISHVVRGNEYLASAPKYTLLYQAFGWEEPIYIHVEHIMRDKQHKLSKRDGDASYDDLIAKGYLSEAIVNYIALLGWSPKGEREIFTLPEIVSEFDISGISKSPAIFDPQKLRAINGEYIRAMTPEKFAEIAEPYIRKTCKGNFDILKISSLLQPRTEVLTEIPDQVDFFDEMPDYSLELYSNKKMKTSPETALTALERALPVLEGVTEWNFENLHDALFALIADMGVKNGYVLWPVRVAISGKQFTPGGAIEIAEIIGRDETLKRMKKSLDMLTRGREN